MDFLHSILWNHAQIRNIARKIVTFWHPFTEKPDFPDLLEFFEEILEFLAQNLLEFFPFSLEYLFSRSEKKAWKLVKRTECISYGFALKKILAPKNFMNSDLLFTKPISGLAELWSLITPNMARYDKFPFR